MRKGTLLLKFLVWDSLVLLCPRKTFEILITRIDPAQELKMRRDSKRDEITKSARVVDGGAIKAL